MSIRCSIEIHSRHFPLDSFCCRNTTLSFLVLVCICYSTCRCFICRFLNLTFCFGRVYVYSTNNFLSDWYLYRLSFFLSYPSYTFSSVIRNSASLYPFPSSYHILFNQPTPSIASTPPFILRKESGYIFPGLGIRSFQKNKTFYKRKQRSLRSFTFFIK